MRFETMPTSPLKLVIQQLRTASERDGAGRTDGELLTRFLSQRDNDALAALVHRHAPMVWASVAAYSAGRTMPKMRFRLRSSFLFARRRRCCREKWLATGSTAWHIKQQ
jgi:hypothetical protein